MENRDAVTNSSLREMFDRELSPEVHAVFASSQAALEMLLEKPDGEEEKS